MTDNLNKLRKYIDHLEKWEMRELPSSSYARGYEIGYCRAILKVKGDLQNIYAELMGIDCWEEIMVTEL